MQVVTRSEFGGELAKMVTAGWIPRVVKGIEAAIARSFATDTVLRPVLTRDEAKRRFEICARGFVTMRRDLHWAVPRIIDELPRYLRANLDGDDWEPADHGGWNAGAETKAMVATGIFEDPTVDPDPDPCDSPR